MSKKMERIEPGIWLGWGGEWGQYEAQSCYDIMRRNTKKLEAKQLCKKGAGYIHGLLEKEEDIFLTLENAKAHVLVTGASGSGKTRFLDLVVKSLIYKSAGGLSGKKKKSTLIIIDPKSDKDIRDICRRSCEEIGEPERFMLFHPAHPRDSIRLNPLKNFTRSSEITSRVISLLPMDGDTFYRDIAGMIVQQLVDAMLLIGEQVTLASLQYYYQHFGLLLELAISEWSKKVGFDWQAAMAHKLEKVRDEEDRAILCVEFYRGKVEKRAANDSITSMSEMYVEKRKLLEQSTVNLITNLSKVTNESMKEMLSPSDTEDPRPIMDMQSIVNMGGVLFIGTDSLADSFLSTALAQMILSDLTSIAASRYNFQNEDDLNHIHIIIDEASQCLKNNDSIQKLVAQSRGSGCTLWISTQSISDLTAELGSEAHADQIIASTANYISFRCKDEATQQRIAQSVPLTRIRYVMHTQSYSTNPDDIKSVSTNLGEKLMFEEVTAFPAELMSRLPDLEYVGAIAGGKFIKGRIPILSKPRL